MSPKEFPGVIIDGAVPRSQYERCTTLFDYLITISDVGPHAELDPGHEWQKIFGDLPTVDSEASDDQRWTELEDEILAEINKKLPDDYVCTLGEAQPGDVIVREIDKDETDDDDDPWGQMMGRNT